MIDGKNIKYLMQMLGVIVAIERIAAETRSWYGHFLQRD